jgi:hypothetical protein
MTYISDTDTDYSTDVDDWQDTCPTEKGVCGDTPQDK